MTKETKEITITKEIYRAEDGTEFVSRLRCEDYEWELNQKKRKQAIEPLKVYLNEVNWPSICNPDGPAHEYHWYKVNSENDVKLVCDGLKDYHRDFRDYKNVMPYLKFSPTYPDYICLVDFPHGGEDTRWVTLSRLIEQSNLFLGKVVELDNASMSLINNADTIELNGNLEDEIDSIKKEISEILSKMVLGHNYRETSGDMTDRLFPYVYQIIEDDFMGQEEEVGRLTVTEEMIVTAMMLYVKN